MSFSNYGQLKTFLGTFSNRTDTSAWIGDVVGMAENLIAQKVRATEMVTAVVIDEDDRSSGAVYTLPSNYLGTRSLYGTYSSVEYPVNIVSLGELRTYKASVPPYFASTYGYSLEFRGTPDTDSAFDLLYYARPAAMSSDSDAPLLLTNHPNLYIHAGLHYVHLKTQDLELANSHKDLFEDAQMSVNALASEQRGGSRTQATANLMNYNRSSM